MIQIYLTLFQMFFCGVLGFILRKRRVIDERTEKTLTEILLQAVLPFSIIASSQYVFSTELVQGLIAVALASMLYYCTTLLIMRMVMRKSKVATDEARVMRTTIIFANTGFVGLPLMEALFGASGLLLGAVYNIMFNVFFYTFGVHTLSGSKFKPRELIMNPVTAAAVLAIILFVIPWRMPAFVINTINLVGDMTIPLSMIIAGSIFSTIDFRKFFGDGKSFVVSLMRLVVLPAVMFVFIYAISMMIPMLKETASVIVMMTALPCGIMNVLIAERENTAPKFAARTVIMSFVFMLVTLPVFVFLCARFLW
ncbi:hypothetical protein SAMN02910456_00508 [Ruminococcaceae bacterium YRB3002]|nr:hypothetical protein SAMN02910456_00508 [Ruminococcaceae bacterium YRB3002]